VSADAPADLLAGRRHVALILRLVVERDGALVYGDLLTLDSQPKGHFATWPSLLDLLEAAVAPAK
jgi:hypothetical protein